MKSTSSNTNDSFGGSLGAPREPHSISESISLCAADAKDRNDFLQLAAAELAGAFNVGIVAVDLGDGIAPMMLVCDPLLGTQIDRESIRHNLNQATLSPTACDIPYLDATGNAQVTRGFRVQVNESPEKIAFLLIYDSATAATTGDTISQLKQVGIYTEAIRANLLQFLPGFHHADADARTHQPTTAANLAAALRNRQSLQMFHQDLNVDATAYRIANESRRLLQCDRVTVLLSEAGRFRVKAISGVSTIDKRSNSVRCAEDLAGAASVMSKPMIVPNDEQLPPQITTHLDEYLDETGVTKALILPLHRHQADKDNPAIDLIDPLEDNGSVLSVIMLEYFTGDAPDSITSAMRLIASEAILALQNSLEHGKIFGLSVLKTIGSALEKLRRPLVALAATAILLLLLASAVVPIEHYVIATGTSQPAAQRQVFAKVDGIVKKIHVTDGQPVKAGDPILDLENAELEGEAEAITGQILTAAKRLTSIQAVRLIGNGDSSQAAKLAMEERQLQSELKNLRAQRALIEQQQADLKITAPIDGTVVAWQLDRRLADRPVARGNLLVSIIDQSGPWTLQLTVPDYNAGPVLQAFDHSNKLPVRFAVATLPDSSFAATMNSISTATRRDELGQHVVDVVATVSEDGSNALANGSLTPFQHNNARLGADVTAKIATGKRTILRSWCGDVFDFVDRNILFYLR